MELVLKNRFEKIEKFINQSGTVEVPEEVRSYLFRLGAVLICGNIEQSIKVIIMDRLSKKAQPKVLKFIGSHLDSGRNYKCPEIETLLRRFDETWGNNFHKFIDENPEVKDGVDSCYAIRNSVAHGGTQSIGNQNLKRYFDISEKLMNGIVKATR